MALSNKWTELFGASLMKGTEEVDTMTALKDCKMVAIYFSAHWCPPCRGFTPKLAEWYKTSLKAKGMEVVFASSDRDESAFKEYYAEMPWLAMKFSERDLKAKLGDLCQCQGIPHLALFNPDTTLVTLDGRSAVSGDPTGNDFPWPEKSISELLEPLTFDKKGSTFKISDLKGKKKIGIYFSAHWCPPCRNFTPKLAELYKKIAEEKNWEVIFVSSDRDEAAFNEYYGEMPWACLPFAERDAKGKLSSKFGVEGIPTLVMLDENLELISDGAVGSVHKDAEGKDFPWASSGSAFTDIDENPEGIDEMPALCVIDSEVDDAEKENNRKILKTLGEAANAKAEAKKAEKKGKTPTIFDLGADEDSMKFFEAPQSDGRLRQRVADECSLKKEKKTQVVMLAIHKQGGYYSFPADKAFTQETAEQFISDFKAGKLTRKQMGAGDDESIICSDVFLQK